MARRCLCPSHHGYIVPGKDGLEVIKELRRGYPSTARPHKRWTSLADLDADMHDVPWRRDFGRGVGRATFPFDAHITADLMAASGTHWMPMIIAPSKKTTCEVNGLDFRVVSSGLCKLPKGVLTPLQIEPVEDQIDNPIHTLHIDKAHHRPSPSTDLHEAPFDDVGRPQSSPERARIAGEGQQLGENPAAGWRPVSDTRPANAVRTAGPRPRPPGGWRHDRSPGHPP